ncbi:MAG: hypothetical protein GX666_08795 [Tissierellia bacterium]|nr:hypothetical protein [Tissierellia bacterium]
MDWSKTKTRLIIILLILNISLGALFFLNKSNRSLYFASKETLDEVKIRLNKYGIGLEAEIPKSPDSIKPLIVKYEEESPEEINLKFFDGMGKIQADADISKITKDEEEITIINNRRLLYENTSQEEGEETFDYETVARQFISDKGFDSEDLFLVKILDHGDSKTFEFTRKYEKKLVETSYTRVNVARGMVVTMDRLWIEVIEEDMRNIEIEPAYKALFSLLDKEEYIGDTINSIELCYYFNPEEQGILEDNTRAERGRAIPGWRIGFKSGEALIVDNY